MTPNFSEWDDKTLCGYLARADVQKALAGTPIDEVMSSPLVEEVRRRNDENPLWFVMRKND